MAITIRDIRNTLFSKELDNNCELKNNLMTMILEKEERQMYLCVAAGLVIGIALGLLFGFALSSTVNPQHGYYSYSIAKSY